MLTKMSLIKAIADRTEIDADTVRRVMSAFMATTEEQMRQGEDVILRGFGRFHKKHCAERSAAIIKTGERIRVPSHDKAAFTPAKRLRDI